jgi:hypothetical protein
MKKIIYIVLLVTLCNCSINKEPVFVKLGNYKVTNFTNENVHLKVDAFFKNPNDVGGKISTDDIMVIINNQEVAKIIANEYDVPVRKEFTMPLEVDIPTKKIFNDKKNGILQGLINSLLKRSVKVQLKGNLQYRFLLFKKNFVVNHTKEIKL